MKRSTATIIFLLLLAPGTISAMPTKIELVCQTHHVWGFAGSEPERGSYDITDIAVVSGSAEGRNMDGRRESVASNAGDFSIGAEGYVQGTATAAAYAEAVYLFTSNVEGLTLTFDGYGECGGGGFEAISKFSFYDVTAQAEIDRHLWRAYWEPGDQGTLDYVVDWAKYYTVEPSHEYRLWIYGEIYKHAEGGTYTTVLNTQIVPVPAPGALILAGIGVGCLSRLRRRRTI